MASAGPSEGFLSRVFGSKKKKRTEDINLPSKGQERASDQKRVKEAIAKPREKTAEQAEKPSGGNGLLSRMNETKKKYNPFDRFVAATSGKK